MDWVVDIIRGFMNMLGFNVENASEWFYIQGFKNKSSKSFIDYAIRRRSMEARVWPLIEESHMKDYFINSQEQQYYDRMMMVAEKIFAEIIKFCERIEEGIKMGLQVTGGFVIHKKDL